MTQPEEGRRGVSPTLTGHDLIAAIPVLANSDAEIAVRQFRQQAGSSLDLADLIELSQLISKTFEEGALGVVVTQGTDTIEETAFLLDVLHSGSFPVVVTGAMRNPTLVGADGPANLLAAIQVASSPQAVNLGCLVVMNDEIHSARHVRKTHANSTAAFSSPETGPLGRIVENRLVLHSSPLGRVTLDSVSVPDRMAVVKIYTSSLGDDGSEIDHLSGSAEGLVVAGFGGGHVHPRAVAGLSRAAKSIPVILTSRTGAGVVLGSTYGFPGSEDDLLGKGLISGGSLDPFKARILLGLLLGANADRETIRKTFDLSASRGPLAQPYGPRNELTITWRRGN